MRPLKAIATAVSAAIASLSLAWAQEAPPAETVAQPAPVLFRLDTSFQARCQATTVTTRSLGFPNETVTTEVDEYLDYFAVDGGDLVLSSLRLSPSDAPSLYARFGPDGQILAVEQGSYSSPQEWLIVSRTLGVVDGPLLAEVADQVPFPLEGRLIVPGDLLFTPTSLESRRRGVFAMLPADLAVELTIEDDVVFVGLEQGAEGDDVLVWEGPFRLDLATARPEVKLNVTVEAQYRAEFDLDTGHLRFGRTTSDRRVLGPDGDTARIQSNTEEHCTVEPVPDQSQPK